MNTTTETELGMEVAISLKKPSAWSGGVHTGERLGAEQRAAIRDLWGRGWSKKKIAEELGHSRNTVAEIIDEDGEVGAHLRETRQTRQLVEEEELRRVRAEVIEQKQEEGKLSVADLNSALLIAGVGIRDAGGSAPQRVEVRVEHEFHAAAALMAGSAQPVARAAASFAPVIEAEVVGEEVGASR